MVRETRHLWVGNLPDNIREERILEHFKRYGKVQSVKILSKKDEEACNGVGANNVSGGGGTCATVAFIDIKSAAKAHNADNKIEERTLKTDYYEPPVNSTATSAIFIHERDDSLGRPAGAPYSSNRQSRYPIGIQDDRNYDRSGYYYDRATPGERDTYVRRSLGLGGYHDDEAYPPVSRGRSRDRYIRTATAGGGGTSAYQDANERNQNHFGGHRNRQHFEQQRYPSSGGGSEQYSAAGEERENSGTRNGGTTVASATSRRPSVTVPTVTSTVTSPPHNNNNGAGNNAPASANVTSSNGGTAGTRQQRRTKKASASRSRSRSRSNSHSRSRSSSRSSNGSNGSSSVSSKLRSSSSNSSSRSRSPSKSRSPAASHCSQSSGKSGRVGDRPASAITGPVPSSVPFIQSAVTTPSATMVSSSCGSATGNVMVASQVTLPPNSGVAILASSLSEGNCCDKDDKRPLGICVRNLPVRSTDTSLKDGLFHEYKKHGKVTMVKVIGQGIDRYAVVCFKKPEDVEKALEVSKDKLFFGCKIEVTAHEGLDGEDNEFRPLEADLDEFHPKATRTLFIGNLEKDITTTELRKHFDQFGEIIEIDIKKQGSASSYAFIQYSDIGSVVKAMRKLDGENLGSNRIKLGFGKSMPTNCVWLDGVTDGILEKFLARHFNRFGPVNYTAIDRERGHALVFYDTTEFAQIAVSEMRGRVLGGKRLQVDYASRECQQVFFEKLELSGQMIPSGADRPWERTRERRDFDVIRDERPIQEPDIAKPKAQTREARVGFENRTYPRYENPPRPNSRGSFRGTVQRGTFNARGRGTQSFPTSRNYDDEFSQGSGASFEDSYEQELREYGYSQRERREYVGGEERVLERNVRGRSFSPLRRRDSASVSPNSRERHKDDRSGSPAALRENRSNSLRVLDKHEDHYGSKERYLEELEDGKERLKSEALLERLSRKRNKHSSLPVTLDNDDHHSQSPTRSRHQSRSQSPAFLCKERKNSKDAQHDRNHGGHLKSPNNSQDSSRVSSPSRENDIADTLMDYSDHKEQINKRKISVEGKFDLRDSLTPQQGSSHPTLKSCNAISLGDGAASDASKRKSAERQEALDARHPDSLVSFSGLSERKKRLLAMSGTPLVRSEYHGKNKSSECLSARSSIDSKNECELNEDKHLRLVDSRKKHGHIFHLLDHLAERSSGTKCSSLVDNCIDSEKPSQKKAKILVRDLSPPLEASTKEMTLLSGKDSKERPHQRHSVPVVELDHAPDYPVVNAKTNSRKTVSDPRNKSSDLHHSHFVSQRLKKMADLDDGTGADLASEHDALLTSNWRKSSLQHPAFRRDETEGGHDKLLIPPFGVHLANEVSSTSDSIPHSRHGKSRSLLESLHDTKKERDTTPLSLPLPKFAATLRTPKASPNPLSSPTPSSVSPNETTSPKNTFVPSKLALATPTAPAVEEKRVEKTVVELPVPMEEVNSIEIEPKTEPLVITTEFKDGDAVVSEISSPLLSPADKILVKDIEESCSSSEEPTDTNRPSIEERIRALDEKYNAWSGSTRSFSSSLSGDSPTTPAVTIDYQKYNIKRRPRYSFLTNDVKPEPSEIMKSLLAKSTIFDQDSKRLQHINEKYEPKEVKIETSVKTRPSFRTKAEAKEFSLPIQLNTYVNNIVVPTAAANATSNAAVGFVNNATTAALLPLSQCSPPLGLSHNVVAATPAIKTTSPIVDSIPSLKPMATPEKLLLSALPLTKIVEPSKPVSCLKESKSPTQSVVTKLTVEVNNCPASSMDLSISPNTIPNVAIKKEALSPVKTETVTLVDPRKEARERSSSTTTTSVNCSLPIKDTNVKKESPEGENIIVTKKESSHQSSRESSRKDRESTKESSHRKDHNRNSNTKKEDHSSTKENISSAGNTSSHRRDSVCETSSVKELKENKKESTTRNNNNNSNNDHENVSNHVGSNTLKRRITTSLDSSESDSGKSTEQSFHERETWRRKDSHSDTKNFEPETKKSKMVNSIKEVEKHRDVSHSPPPLIKKPTESKKERTNSGKSEKSSTKSSKYESGSGGYEKEDSSKTSEQKSKSKHESSRSKDEKRNKSKEGREKSEHNSSRSAEKSSSKSSSNNKYNSESKSSEKDSRSTGSSHSGSNASKSSGSKKESSHGGERDKQKSEKKSSSGNSGERSKQENSGSSKSKNNKKRSKQKQNFWEDEPVYFSMYDKVKARSSKTQTIKDKQKDLESVRQKFNQLKQSRAKREEKSKSMDSDRDSDMMLSPHSSDSEGNKSKSSPPLNKTKQLKKKKLVIESSSDEENRQPHMDIFFDDTSSKLDKDHSSNSDSDSELDFCKLAQGSKNKTKKLDIYDLDSSDQDEPAPMKYMGRKKNSSKSSVEKTPNQRPKVIKSDFESSDNEMFSLKSQSTPMATTPIKKKEHKKKKSSRKEKQPEIKSDYEMSEDESMTTKKESVQTPKKSNNPKPVRESSSSVKEERSGGQNPFTTEKLSSQEPKLEKTSSELESKSHKMSDSKDAFLKSKNLNAKKKKKSKKTSKVKEKKPHSKSGQDDSNKKPDIDKLSHIDDDDDDDELVSKQKSLSPPKLQCNVLSENEDYKSDFSDFEFDRQRSTDKEERGSFWPSTDMKVDFDADTSRCDSSSALSIAKGKKTTSHPVMSNENLSENERPFYEEDYHHSPTKKQSAVSESKIKYSPLRDSSSDEGHVNRLFEDNSCMNDLENSDRDSFTEHKISKQEDEKRKKKKVVKDKKKKQSTKETPVIQTQPKEIPMLEAAPICSPNFFDKILSPNDDESKLSEDIRLDEEIAEEARRLEEELLAASEETSTFGDSESVSKKVRKHEERRFEEEAAKETRRLEEELFMSNQHHWHLKDDDNKSYPEETHSVPVLLQETPPKETKCEEKVQTVIKETRYTGLNSMRSPLPAEGNQPNPIDFIVGTNEVQDPFKMSKEGSPYEIDNERKIEDDLAVCALLQEMNNDIPPELPKETEFMDSVIDQHTEEDADAVNYLLEQHSEPLVEPESVPELSPENLDDFKTHHEPNIFEDLEENPFASEPTSIRSQGDAPTFDDIETDKTRRESSDAEVDTEAELASSFIMPKAEEPAVENVEEPQRSNSVASASAKVEEEEETVPEAPPVESKEPERSEEVADNPSPPEQPTENVSHSPEVSQPDNIPELSVPELPVPELPVPELPVPELSVPELPVPELSVPELPVPELPVPEPPVQELSIPELPVSNLSSNEIDGESDLMKSDCKKLKKKKRKDSKGKRDSNDEFDASQLEIQKDLADSFLNLSELSNTTNITPSIPPVLEVEKPKEVTHPLNLLNQHDDYNHDLHQKLHKDPFRPTLFKDELFKEQILESLSNTKQVHHFKENTFKEVIEPFTKKEELFKKEFDFPKTDSGIEISDFTKDTDLASNSSPLADHASEETEIEQDDTKDYQNDDYYNSPKDDERLDVSEDRNNKRDGLSTSPKDDNQGSKNNTDDKEDSKVEESVTSNENGIMSPSEETEETLVGRPLTKHKAPSTENLIEANLHVEDNKKPERPRRGRRPKTRKNSESSNYDLAANEPLVPITPQRTSSRRARQTAPERCRRSLRSDPYALLSPPELSNHGSNDEPSNDKHEGDFNEDHSGRKSETTGSPVDKNDETILDNSHHEETSNEHSNVEGNVLKEEPKKRRGRKKKMSGEHHQNYLSSPPPLEKSDMKIDDNDPGKENHRGKESRLWLSISASDKTAEPKVTGIKSNSSVYDVFEFRDSEDEELNFEPTNKERIIDTRTTPHVSEVKHESKTPEPLQPSHAPISHEKDRKHEDIKVHKVHEDGKHKIHEEGGKHKVHDDVKHKVHEEGGKHKVHDEGKHKIHEEIKHKIHDETKHTKTHEESKHKAHDEKEGGPKEYVTELSQHGKISITIRLHQRDGTDGNGASTAEVVKTSEAVSEETKVDGLRVEKNILKQDTVNPAEPQNTNVRQTRKSSRLTAQINKSTIEEVIEEVVKGNFKSTEGVIAMAPSEVVPARATRRTRASRRSEEALARLGEDSSSDAHDNSKNKNEPIFIIPDNKVKDQPPLDVGKPLSFLPPPANLPPPNLPPVCEPGQNENDTPKAETKISLRYYRIARANARADNQPKDDAPQGNARMSGEDVIQNVPTTVESSHTTCPSLPVMKVELPTMTPPTSLPRTKTKDGEKGDGDEDSDSRSSPTVLIDPVTGFLTPVNKKIDIRPPTSMSQELLKSITNANTTNTHSNALVSTPAPVLSEPSSVITKNSNIVMNCSAPGLTVATTTSSTSTTTATVTTITPVTTTTASANVPTITSQPITIKIPVASQKHSVVVEPHQKSPKLPQLSVISSVPVSAASPVTPVTPKAPKQVIKDMINYSMNSTLPPPITVLTSSITTAASVVVSSPTFADVKHTSAPRTFTENAIPRPSKELIAKIMGEHPREQQPQPQLQISQVPRTQASRVVVSAGHSLPPPLVHSQVTVASSHTTPVAVTTTPSVQGGGKPQTPMGHPSVPVAQSVPGWPQAVSYQTAFPPQIPNTHHAKVGKLPPPAQTVVSYSGVRTVPSIPPMPSIGSHSGRSVTNAMDSSARTSGIQHHLTTSSPSTHPSNIPTRTETNVITSGVSSKEAFQNMPKPPVAHSGSTISHLHPPVSETRPITPGEGAPAVIQSGSSRNTSRTPPTSSSRGLSGFQPEGNNHHMPHQLSANPNSARELQSNHGGSKHASSSGADARASHMVPNMVKASHQQVAKLSPTFLAQAGFALPGFDPSAVHANAQGTPTSGVIAELLQNPHFFQQHQKEILAQFNERLASQMVRPSTPSSASGHPEMNRLGNPTPPHTPTPPVTTAAHVLQPSDMHLAAASLHMRHLSQSPLLVPHHGMHPSELNAYVHQQMLYAAATHPHYAMHPELRAQQEAQARAAALGIARFGYPAMAPAATPPMNFRQPAEPRLPHPSSAETKPDLKPSVEPAKVPADRLGEGHHHLHHHHHESSKVKNETETKSNAESKRNEEVERERHHSGHGDSKHGPGPPPPLSANSLRPHVPYPTPVRQLSPHLSVSPHERITDSPAVANLYAQNQIRGGHHMPPDHKVDLSRQPPPTPLQLAAAKQQHEPEPEIKPPAAHQNPPSTIPMYAFEPNSHKPMGMDRGPPPNSGVLALKKDSAGSSQQVMQLSFPPGHGEPPHHVPDNIAPPTHSKHHASKEGYNRVATQASINLSNQHASVLPGLPGVGFPGMPSTLAVGDNNQRRGSVPTPQTGSEAPIHQPSPARAILQPSGVTRTQPQTPPHASQVPAQGDSFLLQRYPVMWQGLLALKNDQAAVQMHFVSGNPRIAQHSLPAMSDSGTAPVRIAQRMRLEQTQVEGVARKMQMLEEHCILLALPCGRDHMDVLQQSNNLKNGLINYLQLKQAAGIVNAAAPGSQQPAYVIHVFPSCEFSDENMTRIAPDLLHSVSDIAHLLIIITTV